MPSPQLEADLMAWSKAERVLGTLAHAVEAIEGNDAVFVALTDAMARARRHAEKLRERSARRAEAEGVGYPTVFAEVLAGLSGHWSPDTSQLARDVVAEVGPPYGEA
jgi:hypothetical protein